MLEQTGRDEAFHSQCLHCGCQLAAPLMFCPQCGANQLAAEPDASGAFVADPPPPSLLERLRAFRRTPPEESFVYVPVGRQRRLRRIRRSLYGGGAVVVAAVAAYLVIPGNSPKHHFRDASGSVASALDEDAATPPMDQNIDIAGLNIAPTPGSTKPAIDIAGLDIASQPVARETAPAALDHPPPAPASKHDTSERRDATRQLAIARTDLARNRLWPARRAITNALAADPDNANAQQLRTELASRERERDALIGHASECARHREWRCVHQYAARAASVDTSSRDARRLLARSTDTPREIFVHRSPPNLFAKLHHWFRQSLAEAESRPSTPPQWERP